MSPCTLPLVVRLLTAGEVEYDAEGGLDLVVLGGDGALVVHDDQPGGVAVLARLEVEQEVAAQAAPSLNRHCKRGLKCI